MGRKYLGRPPEKPHSAQIWRTDGQEESGLGSSGCTCVVAKSMGKSERWGWQHSPQTEPRAEGRVMCLRELQVQPTLQPPHSQVVTWG